MDQITDVPVMPFSFDSCKASTLPMLTDYFILVSTSTQEVIYCILLSNVLTTNLALIVVAPSVPLAVLITGIILQAIMFSDVK